jgi:23S rRNA pseudouridine1911/1915/1917 synthase
MKSKKTDIRLDLYLAEELGFSRAKIQKTISEERVSVNGQTQKASYILQLDDQIDILDIELLEKVPDEIIPIPNSDIPLDIQYEDDSIIVVHKQVGLSVHPANPHQQATLVNGLLAYTSQLSDMGGRHRPGIVHRLDKETEGLLVIAKTNAAHENLKEQFKMRTVDKRYFAMVKGDVKQDEFEIDLPIGRHPKRHNLRSVVKSHDPYAKQAITVVKVIKRYRTKTLLDITLKTGRTHQIRVHMAHLDHPVLGDNAYGPHTSRPGQLLQSYYLSFDHPVTKERMVFELPVSERLDVN